MTRTFSFHRIIMWTLLATLFAGLVWAVDNFLDAADKNAQMTASIGADYEMEQIKTTAVKPKKADNIQWGKINQLEKRLEANTKQYQTLLTKAGTEKTANNGNVTDATRQAGIDSAKQFSQISSELAAVYRKSNCISRAKTVDEAAKSRMANAEMAFSSLDSGLINDYNKQQGLMASAGNESLAEVKSDASAEDIAQLKKGAIPLLTKMIAETSKLAMQILSLVNELRRIASGDVVAIAGCVKNVVTGAAQNGPAGLLMPVMSLLDTVKSMGSNLAATLSAVKSL